MKTALYTLTLPVLWFVQILTLIGLVMIHILAAPVRAFIYWGRALEQNPGWRGFIFSADTKMGIGIPKEGSDEHAQR